jgi:hypothetical protein
MLSAALSRTQLFPAFVVLSKTPLPPAAHASSYYTTVPMMYYALVHHVQQQNMHHVQQQNTVPVSDSRHQGSQNLDSALAPLQSLQLSTYIQMETNNELCRSDIQETDKYVSYISLGLGSSVV